MRSRVWLRTAAGIAAMVCLLPAAWAQVRFGLPDAGEIAAGKDFVAPKIGEAYAKRLAEQPDLQGHWIGTGTGFDPLNFHTSFTVEQSATFNINPGSYLTKIPYKPEYLAQYQQIIADGVEGRSTDTFALCQPFGMPRIMTSPAGVDILQSPELIVIHDAYGNETRRVFLDGRPHPSALGFEDSSARTRTGHSTGHWEGDTLVVDTVNIAPGVYDGTLAPHSEELRVTERFRLLAQDLLEIRFTLDDPVMFTAPWNVTRHYRRILMSALQNQPGGPVEPQDRKFRFHNLFDHPCEQTIDMSKGYQSLILPQEEEAAQRQAAP